MVYKVYTTHKHGQFVHGMGWCAISLLTFAFFPTSGTQEKLTKLRLDLPSQANNSGKWCKLRSKTEKYHNPHPPEINLRFRFCPGSKVKRIAKTVSSLTSSWFVLYNLGCFFRIHILIPDPLIHIDFQVCTLTPKQKDSSPFRSLCFTDESPGYQIGFTQRSTVKNCVISERGSLRIEITSGLIHIQCQSPNWCSWTLNSP